MSMQDPIADLLTRIRNAQAVNKVSVDVPFSKLKQELVRVLKEEGYISEFSRIEEEDNKPVLRVFLKYFDGKGVISKLRRISRPGLRAYRDVQTIPYVLGGLGTAIMSTSRGVMSGRQARKLSQGGELLCVVE
jgi:small subunit ribosomal protein S8